jgi:succinate dehydrogenase (ubiquinone) flavoprotein subunit
MGGVPTNYKGQVIQEKNGKDVVIKGLYGRACANTIAAENKPGESFAELPSVCNKFLENKN